MKQTRLHLMSIVSVLNAGMIAGCTTIGFPSSGSNTDTRIQISSEPPGAAVYIMGTKAGVTPMLINDSDIYPAYYKSEVEKHYGKVILRKEGCKEFSRQLTRSDVVRGLDAQLDCGDNFTTTPVQKPSGDAQPVVVPAEKPQPEASIPSPTLPELQLEQLRTLQKLQEEGVLSEDEEKKLRKRILNNL